MAKKEETYKGNEKKKKERKRKGGGSEGGEWSESSTRWDTLLMALSSQSAEEIEVGFSAPQLLE